MAMTVGTGLPSIFTPMASQMNLRELPNAKSRTLSALYTQVFLSFALVFSFSVASACVTMTTGLVAVLASSKRLS